MKTPSKPSTILSVKFVRLLLASKTFSFLNEQYRVDVIEQTKRVDFCQHNSPASSIGRASDSYYKESEGCGFDPRVGLCLFACSSYPFAVLGVKEGDGEGHV
jgi:hypothetical protein